MSIEELMSNETFTGTILPTIKAVALAIVVLWVGKYLISKVVKLIGSQMEKKNTDATLRPFFMSMLSIGLQAMLYITVIGVLGIETTSFAAILAAAGLAIGMALSGTLQNFAGGVMILLFKPFLVGNLIEAQGHLGIVKEISLFITVLNTLDNKTVIIPNGPLSNDALINYSTEDLRRVDLTIGMGYGDDVVKAKEVLMNIMKSDSRVVQDPAPFVAVESLGDSSVNFTVRAWGKQEDYWDIYFAINENVYTEFSKKGLNIPFPQMDVHVHNS